MMKFRWMLHFRIVAIFLIIVSCSDKIDYRLENTTQLTFKGDNGEAYFSDDQSKLIFQSKRDGNDCDKLYIVGADGTNLQEFPLKKGAFTCAYFSLDDQYTIQVNFSI